MMSRTVKPPLPVYLSYVEPLADPVECDHRCIACDDPPEWYCIFCGAVVDNPKDYCIYDDGCGFLEYD